MTLECCYWSSCCSFMLLAGLELLFAVDSVVDHVPVGHSIFLAAVGPTLFLVV